jgi:hypothetical protein
MIRDSGFWPAILVGGICTGVILAILVVVLRMVGQLF